MAVRRIDPAPGQQKPEKYPRVGPNYQHYGEQPGEIYNPWTDTYSPDPKTQHDYYMSQGIDPSTGGIYQEPPEKPGMLDSILPFVATGGGLGLGQALVNPNFWSTLGGLGGGTGSGAGAAASASPIGVQGVGPIAADFGGAPGAGAGAATYGSEVAAGGGLQVPGTPVMASGEAPGMLDGLGSMGVFDTGAFGPVSAPGIAAGAATGYLQGKGLYDAIKGKDMSGLSQAALALPTFGASLLYNPIKNALGFGDQDKWKTEGNRLGSLQDKGVYLPDNLLSSMPTGGRGKDELVNHNYGADFVGRDDQGNWVNNLFANDRDVKNLRGEDIVNYSTFAEHDPDWFRKPLQDRINYANQLLQQGAVNEHHGTIDVDWGKAPAFNTPAPGTTTPAPAPTGTTPPKTAGQYMPQYQQKPQQPQSTGFPPYGTWLSPGIYADGKGGSFRK